MRINTSAHLMSVLFTSFPRPHSKLALNAFAFHLYSMCGRGRCFTHLVCKVENHSLDVSARSERLEQPVVEVIVTIKTCARSGRTLQKKRREGSSIHAAKHGANANGRQLIIRLFMATVIYCIRREAFKMRAGKTLLNRYATDVNHWFHFPLGAQETWSKDAYLVNKTYPIRWPHSRTAWW